VKNKAHDLGKYAFTTGEALLLDANVWLYLYPAPSATPFVHAAGYSAAFKTILAAKAQIAMDVLVISEYLNRYCRIEWTALHKGKYPDFKQFRKSADFASVGPKAGAFAKNILALCSRFDHPFAAINVGQVLTDFESGAQDTNDGFLIESCRQHGWKFVTNDGDFTEGGIEVLTNNPKLIAACP
jgi:predicted nucleic acid-binding protein